MRCQLIIAARLLYLETNRFQELNEQSLEIIRSLNKLIKYLKETELKGRKYK